MESKDTIQLKAPIRERSNLSFCSNESETHISNVEHWLKDMTATDYQHNGEQLVKALNELARLNTDPKELYQLAELMRIPTLKTANHLYQHNLRRYITFASSQQSLFDLCHNLHLGLATIYKSVVVCCLDNNKLDNILAAALHRAIADSAATYSLRCLLYRSAPKHLWLDLHTLYQLAETHGHLSFQQNAPADHKQLPMSVENLYKRALLFSRSDANKLSPSENQQLWQILGIWIKHCKITPKSGLKTYFAVNLNNDNGLQYAIPELDRKRDNVIGLDVRVLLAQLEKIKTSQKNDHVLSTTLVSHLITSWSQIQKRFAPRRATSASCETCFGFTGLHYHLSGEHPFSKMVEGFTIATGKSKFSEKQDDIWSQVSNKEERKNRQENHSFVPGSISFTNSSPDKTPNNDKRLSALRTEIINTSHTGFCLKIHNTLDRQYHTGDLVGVKPDQGLPWALYTTRWLGFSTRNDITLGVNLIAQAVEAAAISLIRKVQNASQFMHALMLPDHESPSIIIPNLSDNTGVKFELIHNGALQKGQLTKCTYTTKIWCQYQFKLFNQ